MIPIEFLYHGSPDRHVAEFSPRAITFPSRLDFPAVFATPDPALASCFIVPAKNFWVNIDRWVDQGVTSPWCVAISSKEQYLQNDKGGSIYRLPGMTFEPEPSNVMGGMEWVNKVPITPIDSVEHESGLQAMLEHGVEVYFVNQETFDAIKKSDDHGYEIIQSLEPYQKDSGSSP